MVINGGVCIVICIIQSFLQVKCYSIKSDSLESNQIQHNQLTGQQIVSAHSLSPHLDYNNEWRPVGHGDPLKNDPTFAYSPPTLDSVRYWTETNVSKDNESKNLNRNHDHFPQPFTVADRIGNLGSLRKDVKGVQPQSVQLLPGFLRRPLFGTADSNVIEDVPLLQPKFSGIRRSYYPHDLPMHLMPPPIQPKTQMYYGDLKFKINEFPHKMPYYGPDSSINTPNTQQLKHNASIITHKTSQYYATQEPSSAQQKYFSLMPTIRPVGNMLKPSYMQGKQPWLHELLKKEIVVQSKSPSNTFNQTSVSFVPSTTITKLDAVSEKANHLITTTTAQPIIIKPPSSPTPTLNNNQFYKTTKPTVSSSNGPTITNKSEDLLKPLNVANNTLLSQSKQVDYSHAGPMYLIIEGHSKVKTYGQNEYDPSKPKIVPIIPKREPVAIISNPNDNLKTINKYPVKHLHTKTTPKSTTPVPNKMLDSFIKPDFTTVVNQQVPKNFSVNSNKTELASSTSVPKAVQIQKPSGMQEILNLLGSMFANDAISTNGTTLMTDNKSSNLTSTKEQ